MKLSDWLFDTVLGRVCRHTINVTAPVIAGALTLIGFHHYELTYQPIVKEWNITQFEYYDGKYVVAGTFHKVRPCELIGTSIVAVPKQSGVPSKVLYQISPVEIRGGNVPVGHMTWGPWAMTVPEELVKHRDKLERVDVVALHRCHFLWNQETVYGSIAMNELPPHP